MQAARDSSLPSVLPDPHPAGSPIEHAEFRRPGAGAAAQPLTLELQNCGELQIILYKDN